MKSSAVGAMTKLGRIGCVAGVLALGACAPESGEDASDEQSLPVSANAAAPGDGGAPASELQTLLPPLPTDKVDVLEIHVTNPDGKPPLKGDKIKVVMKVKNLSATAGSVSLTPLVTSSRFTDFKEVPLGTGNADLQANETKDVSFDGGPFIEDAAKKKKYALGRGAYTVPAVRLGGAGARTDTKLTGGSFSIAGSNVVFNAVVYEEEYFRKIKYLKDPDTYLSESFTRLGEVFTPNAEGSSEGTYKQFPGGYDQMMNVRSQFKAMRGLTFKDSGDPINNCKLVGAFGQRALGLARNWMDDGNPDTDPDHHGFDIMVGLIAQGIGGLACTGEGLQYSGLFEYDLSIGRAEMVLVHETSHLAGSPHCDPLQGYMMCSGEKHERFKEAGSFVWHKVSRDTMKDHWD